MTVEANVAVVGWDRRWPSLARAEVARLQDVAPAVEHVGSTAVPGLAAVPVIDLVVGVDDAERHASAVATAVEGLGYERVAEPDADGWGEILLRRESSPPIDVRVVEARGREWLGAVAVRDYLRANADEAASYARAKRRIAADGPTRAVYAARKRPVLETLDGRARRWKAQRPRG